MSKSPPLDGVIVIHKPVGPTSHDVVVCARRALGISRVGHTGTLDPQASGVLPLVLGQATRLAQHLTGTDKEYIATVRFGVTSDTYDASGEIATERGAVPSPMRSGRPSRASAGPSTRRRRSTPRRWWAVNVPMSGRGPENPCNHHPSASPRTRLN